MNKKKLTIFLWVTSLAIIGLLSLILVQPIIKQLISEGLNIEELKKDSTAKKINHLKLKLKKKLQKNQDQKKVLLHMKKNIGRFIKEEKKELKNREREVRRIATRGTKKEKTVANNKVEEQKLKIDELKNREESISKALIDLNENDLKLSSISDNFNNKNRQRIENPVNLKNQSKEKIFEGETKLSKEYPISDRRAVSKEMGGLISKKEAKIDGVGVITAGKSYTGVTGGTATSKKHYKKCEYSCPQNTLLNGTVCESDFTCPPNYKKEKSGCFFYLQGPAEETAGCKKGIIAGKLVCIDEIKIEALPECIFGIFSIDGGSCRTEAICK